MPKHSVDQTSGGRSSPRRRAINTVARLVPDDVRQRLQSLTLCLDFNVAGDAHAEFLRLCQRTRAGTAFIGTSRRDEETALIVSRHVKKGVFHVTIEYKQGMISPHPRVPDLELLGLSRFLSDPRKFNGCTITLWEETHKVAWEAGQGTLKTQFHEVAARLRDASSAAMRITGVELQPATDEGETRSGVQLRWNDQGMTFRAWTRGHVVASLSEAFIVGPAVIDGMFSRRD